MMVEILLAAGPELGPTDGTTMGLPWGPHQYQHYDINSSMFLIRL